jgi:hypothetical protein
MKIITYATHSFGGFDTLIETVPDIVVLGWAKKWNGFMDKFKGVLEYLESVVPDNEVVMVVDGFDTIAKKDLSEVETIFKSMNCKILVSQDPADNYFTKKVYTTCYGTTINTGLYMGYCKNIKKLLTEALQSGEEDDQRAMNMICNRINDQSFIKVDTDHIIFENCYNNSNCVKRSRAYIIGTPGEISISRYFRGIREYYRFFVPEILVLVLVLFMYLNRKSVYKIISSFIKI